MNSNPFECDLWIAFRPQFFFISFQLICLFVRNKTPTPGTSSIPRSCWANVTRIFPFHSKWQGHRTIMEKVHLQGYLPNGRFRSRIFQISEFLGATWIIRSSVVTFANNDKLQRKQQQQQQQQQTNHKSTIERVKETNKQIET